MDELYCRVKEIVSKQAIKRGLTSEDIVALRLLRLTEEIGEASRANRNLGNVKGEYGCCSYRTLRDSLIEESVDCVISSLALLAAASGEDFTHQALFDRKLDKWESNIDKECD